MTRPRTPGRGRRVRCDACRELRYGPLIRGLCAECAEQQQRSEAEFDRLIGDTIPDAPPERQCRYCRAAVSWLNDDGFCSQSCEYRYARDERSPEERALFDGEPWPYGRSPLERLRTQTNNYGLYVGAPTPEVPAPLEEQVRAWFDEDTPPLEGDEPVAIVRGGVVHDGEGEIARLCRRGHPLEEGEIRCYVCHPLEDTALEIDDRASVRGEPGHDLDLECCLEFNDVDVDQAEVSRVLARVPGRWNGENFHWLLELRQGRYCYLVGWCDSNGWEGDSLAQAWFANTPYEALVQDDSLSEDIIRALMSQTLNGFIAGVHERIATSLAQDADKRHKVYQAMGFEMNHTWLCENCEFMTGSDADARFHSEQRRVIDPPPGWIRKPRRPL